jgi:hypothetical protein
MKLKSSVVRELAKMITGVEPYTNFREHSDKTNVTSYDFFKDINLALSGLNYSYALEVLEHYNKLRSSDPDLPSKEIKRIIEYLLDPVHFISNDLDQSSAIESVNRLLKSQKLFVEKDKNTDNVILRKYTDDNIEVSYISTSKDSMKSKKIITFSPTAFGIPDAVRVDLVSVMMPFAKEFNSVLDTLKLSCSNVDMKCLRVDDIWNNSTIIQDVFELIYCSSIVIADFTGRNPNVSYEAGIAHTLGKTLIPITQNVEDIPFDLRHHRALNYINSREGLEILGKNLEKKLKTLMLSLKSA